MSRSHFHSHHHFWSEQAAGKWIKRGIMMRDAFFKAKRKIVLAQEDEAHTILMHDMSSKIMQSVCVYGIIPWELSSISLLFSISSSSTI